MGKDKKDIEIPKCVKVLKMSKKKYAKKNDFNIDSKKMGDKERKRKLKKLTLEYNEDVIKGLDKAVKILSEVTEESKKLNKIKAGVESVIVDPSTMDAVAELYKKHPENYPNMIFLPYMIISTITYYRQEDLTDEEKEFGKRIHNDDLIEFCEKILRKIIKQYKKHDLDERTAFHIATVIPSTKLLAGSRKWFRNLISTFRLMSETEVPEVKKIFKAILKLDGKKYIGKKLFYELFYQEFILTKLTNKKYSSTETQKEFYEKLVDMTLDYLNDLKVGKLKGILKQYIKARKKAEEFKTDGKRIIKFIDHATSNSPYQNIKAAVQELIADDKDNELYLS